MTLKILQTNMIMPDSLSLSLPDGYEKAGKVEKYGSSGSDVLRRLYPLKICRVRFIRMIQKYILAIPRPILVCLVFHVPSR